MKNLGLTMLGVTLLCLSFHMTSLWGMLVCFSGGGLLGHVAWVADNR